MRFKRQLKLQNGLEQIILAPLIDLVLLILVFFLLFFSFTTPFAMNIKLPKTIISDDIKEENLIITITGENVMYLNNKIATIKELRHELETSLKTKPGVLIKAARRSSVGRIADVWDLCRDLGIERINIATDQEKK